ncbi:MYXO-CTERM sorting domain-containing protein [Nannocystis sp. SCPEA4]|uniref:MYXO-CTERM sorting domain-containing protein n=1 Tax=Nannocystis sp. SCPEA4 TaxID=2996787 RepID=UPI002270D298|nr:MYXO-CTERM sorting domain-containing protein [Nannocystis sp. SCPEA4]MCY1054027.1 MYXO-CTERM sorting domain-containing protein [Nannocystis sp. SCPEA4]
MRNTKTLLSLTLGAVVVGLAPSSAAADDFAAGSLIVPMDTTYQDLGMFEAYGLVYELLRQGVPVRWVIKVGKGYNEIDFMAMGTDVRTGVAIAAHGYRGGPWVIDAADAAAAMPIIEAWQAKNVNTTVHEATAPFTGDVARLLVVAPTIAMMADGNQKIARKYMMAAKIPDSAGNPMWPDSSPDMLDPLELAGPTIESHSDGDLFDEDGDPVYCQFMSMHWGVNDAKANPEVVAEMREFLQHPTHLFAECQAVNAFENLQPHGFFLTPKGFLIGAQPNTYDYYQGDSPFAQIDGPFQSVGGSEPAYTLPAGDSYKGGDIVYITAKGTPVGVNDVWMTGFIDGICPQIKDSPAISAACLTAGKVSYLGGHEYDVQVPISANAKSQGARLFLNSLFEAPCATAEGLPAIDLHKLAPPTVDAPMVTFDIEYANMGAMTALDVTLIDTLPPGVTFVSATDNGMYANGLVTWNLGNLGQDEGGMVSVTVELPDVGAYVNTVKLGYRAGVNLLSVEAEAMTEYGLGGDTDTTGGMTTTSGGSASDGTTGGGTTSDPGVTDASSGGNTGTGGSDSSASSPTTSGGSGNSGGGTGATEGLPTTGGGPGETSGPGDTSGGASDSASDSASGTAGMSDTGGCGCRSDHTGAWGMLAGLGTLALRRRRRT